MSLRRLRWLGRAPRVAVTLTAAVLCAAGLRTVLVHGAPTPAPARASRAPGDLPPEAFAQAFARAYLTWDAARPAAYDTAVRCFAPGLVDEQAVTLPDHGHQSVVWSTVAADDPTRRGRLITVAALTNYGTVRLAVIVGRRDRGLYVASAPAVIGGAGGVSAPAVPDQDPVEDAALGAVVGRALSNYLAGRRDALTADLAPGSVVAVPDEPLRLAGTEQLTWAARGREVDVTVRAVPSAGGELTLAYAVGVVRVAGRWFVRWIEVPSTKETS
jgi:hypothetical protein